MTTRRNFLASSTLFAAGSFLMHPSIAGIIKEKGQLKVALVGTGIRGIGFWGKRIVDEYGDIIEFTGLSDINEGRLNLAKEYLGVSCNTYLDFDEMLNNEEIDLLMVTTVDATHHEFIIKGLNRNIMVLSEKPMTTDAEKCRDILEAERRSEKSLIIGFNYRYNPHYTELKRLLSEQRVGQVTSVDFHWYLNVFHGADYFRRWHAYMDKSGSLWVHKSTHHFDLLNWWLDSDPVEVMAYGELNHYGKNHSFRGENCRSCVHKDNCKFHWDITRSDHYMKLYVANEKYDGYLRDGCVWREDIDIYDKMSAQIKYANGVLVNYSLTTYSPYEGMRIAFNGMDGRIDAWDGIPWRKEEKKLQSELHAAEMNQDLEDMEFEEILVSDNFGSYDQLKVMRERGGHGGGDQRLQDRVFKDPNAEDPLEHAAGSRDGAMSILIGIAARKSIIENRPVRIENLTELVPHPTRGT
jgi:predicted dehydrogenase